jgi:hypothetical protein
MILAVGKAQLLLLVGGEEVWKQTEWTPDVGDNLARLGYPEWYVFQLTERRGRVAYDCRLEKARPPEVESTDSDGGEDLLKAE